MLDRLLLHVDRHILIFKWRLSHNWLCVTGPFIFISSSCINWYRFVFIKCFPTLSVSWPLAFAQGQVWCVYIDWACRTNWTNTFLCCARTARRQWLAPKSGNGCTCYSQASCYRHVTIVTSWTVSAIWDAVMIPWKESIAIPTALIIFARSI